MCWIAWPTSCAGEPPWALIETSVVDRVREVDRTLARVVVVRERTARRGVHRHLVRRPLASGTARATWRAVHAVRDRDPWPVRRTSSSATTAPPSPMSRGGMRKAKSRAQSLTGRIVACSTRRAGRTLGVTVDPWEFRNRRLGATSPSPGGGSGVARATRATTSIWKEPVAGRVLRRRHQLSPATSRPTSASTAAPTRPSTRTRARITTGGRRNSRSTACRGDPGRGPSRSPASERRHLCLSVGERWQGRLGAARGHRPADALLEAGSAYGERRVTHPLAAAGRPGIYLRVVDPGRARGRGRGRARPPTRPRACGGPQSRRVPPTGDRGGRRTAASARARGGMARLGPRSASPARALSSPGIAP